MMEMIPFAHLFFNLWSNGYKQQLLVCHPSVRHHSFLQSLPHYLYFYLVVCMQDTFARAFTRPLGQARATIGYLVYRFFNAIGSFTQQCPCPSLVEKVLCHTLVNYLNCFIRIKYKNDL